MILCCSKTFFHQVDILHFVMKLVIMISFSLFSVLVLCHGPFSLLSIDSSSIAFSLSSAIYSPSHLLISPNSFSLSSSSSSLFHDSSLLPPPLFPIFPKSLPVWSHSPAAPDCVGRKTKRCQSCPRENQMLTELERLHCCS